MENEPSVVVVGAGIGGLVLARALARLGTPVELVEVAESLRAVGAGITLGANAMRVLGELGLSAEVVRRGRKIGGGAITDERGRLLTSMSMAEVEARYGQAVAIDRRALHEALSMDLTRGDGAPVRLRLGTTVTSVTSHARAVEVELSSGERIGARALIGADGIRSGVRGLVFGEIEPKYAGYTCWRFSGHVPGGIEDVVEMWGRGARVGLVPLGGEDQVYAFFVENAPRGTPREPARRRARYVRERFAGFGGDVPRLLAGLGDDDELLHHDIEEVELQSWTRGRVALLGDAAHAMTPNLGQGAAMAIEDALVLARELHAHDDGASALSAYEARRRPRVLDLQARARSLGKVAQWRSPLASWARNWGLSFAPPSAAQKSIERIVGYVP